MLPFVPGRGAAPLDIADVQGPFARVVLAIAIPAGAATLLGAYFSQDIGVLVLAVTAWVTVAVSMVTIAARRENAVLVMGTVGAGVSVAAWLTDVAELQSFASLVVVFVGAAAVVFMQGRTFGFLAIHTGFLFAVHVLWLGWGFSAVLQGLLTTVAFLMCSLGMRWVRDRSMDSASRFLNLFERAPVSLWEEDFSAVGTWLEGLRDQGVTDLAGHLREHPDLFRHGLGLVEVVRVNQAAARFLEVDDPELLVGPLKPETFPDDAMPSMIAQFEAIWNGEDHVTVEVRHGYTVQGNPLWGLLHWAVPRRFGKPDLTRVIVSVVDVTEMNMARETLEQSLKSKDELIATVSHELRTPLTTVVGLSTELSDAYDDFGKDEAQDLLRMIADQSVEVATIVEDLLVAARAESGSLKVSVEPVDLHLEAKTTLRGLDIEEEVDCHTVGVVPTVYADSGRVRQILRNLLVNARRYGATPIRIVVLEAGDAVNVEVRDHGAEISPEEQQMIFDRYYRARQTPGVTASVGLGLTVSRELARLMGGDLTYHHDGESVFTLSLPRPKATESAASA
ncbi:MAG: PAS domain-containing sensor histidine kinase [Acidimicrobiia bacterium]|nr:PAS domain-containing sensor histidine kinase [Acidimicrobiia bacterium]